jgi:hypothetical protein
MDCKDKQPLCSRYTDVENSPEFRRRAILPVIKDITICFVREKILGQHDDNAGELATLD